MKLPNRCAVIPASRLFSVGLLSGLLMCLPAGAQESSVYKWVDENGTPHYTDIPPATGEAEQLAISSRRTDKDAVQSLLANRAEASEAARKSAVRQAEDAAIEKGEQAELAKQRQANCEQARRTQQKYYDAFKLYKLDADGERVYLTDTELDAAQVEAGNAVLEWCGE